MDAATRSKLVGFFVAEVEESVSALRGLAPKLRDRDDAATREFGRIAHGLKGAAAALGYDRLARGLHDLEDLALGIGTDDPEDARARRGRVDLALEVLADGVARMAASAAEAFPDDVAATLLATIGGGARAALEPAGGEEEAAPIEPDAPASAPRGERGRGTTDRISVPSADVDDALRLAASLSRSAAELQELSADAGPVGVDLARAAQGVAASAAALEGLIASLRLLPANAALFGLEQEVDELARRLGKQVALAVSGRDVRADRRTLQSARGLIRHLVRNAVDHGVESPGARAAAGKPASGRLAIDVQAGESMLRVSVADDGAGFDVANIRSELARRGEDAARVASLSDEEVLQLWAAAGGSTRARATDISGRGLGLSAVAQTARAAGGGIRVQSTRGEGSVVRFSLPLEVYAVDALTVSAGDRHFAVPLSAVERTVHLAAAGDAVHHGPTGRTLAVDETILPLGALGQALGVAPASGEERFAIVVRTDAGMAALAVDDVGAVAGIVPAAVAGVAQADALVTGIARLADGTAVAVLDPRLLLERARVVRRTGRDAAPVDLPARSEPSAAAPRALEVVLAEDSLATREVLRVLLEEQGFQVRLAADGEEALQRIAEKLPDVLVSDVKMPRRDGIALARALRARRETARLPIVLLTSQDDEATRAAGAAAGADAYLIKSRFNADVLAETLARIGVRLP